jgi:hypothetical protein
MEYLKNLDRVIADNTRSFLFNVWAKKIINQFDLNSKELEEITSRSDCIYLLGELDENDCFLDIMAFKTRRPAQDYLSRACRFKRHNQEDFQPERVPNLVIEECELND